MRICKWCSKEFEEKFHQRWCDSNPSAIKMKSSEYLAEWSKKVSATRKNRGNANNQFSKAKKANLPVPVSPLKGKPGKRGLKHSEETKRKISQSSRESNHRRLRKKTILYRGVLLDSSWELELAKRLDDIGVEWIRPDPLRWIDDSGLERNYFPDFYLPEYDIYLDPKNPAAYKVQEPKIKCLNSQYDNIYFILTLEECKNWLPFSSGQVLHLG